MLEVKPQPESGPVRSGPRAGLSIAGAARRTGVSVHTLRYYERAGLVVTTVDRTAGGRRRGILGLARAPASRHRHLRLAA